MSNILSKRTEDTAIENIMQENFNKIYNICGMKYIRCSDRETQIKGSDLITFKNGQLYHIDEKCAIDYFNRDLQTFAFELSFIPCEKNSGKPTNERTKGWFLKDDSETDIYALGYVRADSLKKLKMNNISSFEVIFIRKNDIHKLLENRFSLTTLESEANKLITDATEGKIASYGNNYPKYKKVISDNLSLCWSPHLAESPVNLLISKRLLKKYAFKHISFQLV